MVSLARRDVSQMSAIFGSELGNTLLVENIAAHFDKMVLFNIGKAVIEDTYSAQIQYHDAQGLMRGATVHVALLEPDTLFVSHEQIS